jgi:hypothetical protein
MAQRGDLEGSAGRLTTPRHRRLSPHSSDLAFLAGDLTLVQRAAFAVVDGGDQVYGPPGDGARAAQGLAVDCDGAQVVAPAGLVQVRGDPCTDRGVDGVAVEAGQNPAEGGRPRGGPGPSRSRTSWGR